MKELKLSIFNSVDKRIKFYSQNTNLLPPKHKSSFKHLKHGIQEFRRKYVLVPADKAANNVVVGPSIKRKVSYNLLVMIRKRVSLLQTIIEDITFGLVKMYVTPYRFSWTIFILCFALSYTEKLLVFRWLQIVLLL